MLGSTGSLISEGVIEGYEFRTLMINGFHVHDITVIGPISLSTRIPLYLETLRDALPPYYFCIVDNIAGFENTISYDDIRQLDRILIDHGIRKFFGATITKDMGYAKIVKLAQANMDEIGLEGMVIEAPDRAAAEAFIFEKLQQAAAERDGTA